MDFEPNRGRSRTGRPHAHHPVRQDPHGMSHGPRPDLTISIERPGSRRMRGLDGPGRPSRAWPASRARRASAAGPGATPVAARRHPGCHPGPPGRAADARLPGHAGARRAQRRPLAPERRIRLPDAPAARGRGPRHGRGPRRPTHLRADGRRPHRGHRHPGRTALVAVRRRGRPPRARPGARRRCAPGLPGRLADRPKPRLARSSPRLGARSIGCSPTTTRARPRPDRLGRSRRSLRSRAGGSARPRPEPPLSSRPATPRCP